MSTIPGSPDNDSLEGTSDADTFTPGGGDDSVDGKAGNDTAVLTGSYYDYSKSVTKQIVNGVYSFIVELTDTRAGSPDGTDHFLSVENFEFSNGIWYAEDGALDIDERPAGLALSNDSIAENAAVGAVVGTVSAVDPEGKPVAYSLVGGDTDVFELVGTELRTKAALDFETSASHSVTLMATDEIGQSITRTFAIAIDDVHEPGDDITGTSKADTLYGSELGEAIFGLGGKDMISGNGGDDKIDGGRGKDQLSGGDGSDTFQFSGNCGKDHVIDFSAEDTIDLSAADGVTGWRDLKRSHLVERHDDLVVMIDKSNIITLDGVSMSDVGKADFAF